ncbi:hypothetical protein Tco_0900522, partial [Tanacetum coccineum]
MSSYTHPSIPSDYNVEDAFSFTNAPNYTPTSPDYFPDFFPPEDISPPTDTETPVESPIPVSPSSLVGSSSPARSTTPPPDYPFDESIFVELDNSLWIIPRPLGSEPVPEEPDESDTISSLMPKMVPNTEKLMEVFIEGLPRSIEGNVTASKPQTLEEAITITQRLMEQADTESEPFEDLVETESPHTVASPTSLPDSTPSTCHVVESEDSDTSGARSTSSNSIAPLLPDYPLTHTTPALVPSLCKTAHMAVRVPPAMSPSLSASIAEVSTMSDSAFRKRFRSSYDSSPSSSPPNLPSRKRYWEESLDSDSESEHAEDEGPTAEDEDPAAGEEDLAAGDEGPGMRNESLSFGGDEAILEGQQCHTSPRQKCEAYTRMDIITTH